MSIQGKHTRKINLLNIIGVSFFFILNIGSKEIFRFFNSTDYILEGTLLLFSLLSFFLIKIPKVFNKLKAILIFSIILLIISSLTSANPEYGLQKTFLGFFVPLILFSFFVKKSYTKEDFIRGYVLMILVMCITALAVKLRSGFFDRNVSFGLLGPITFGWLNGMAFLLMLLREKRGKISLIMGMFFLLMVIWTGSKGPLLAVILVSLFSFNKMVGSKLSTKLILILSLVLVVNLLSSYSEDIRAIKTVMDFLENPDDYASEDGRGSIGVRQEYLEISYNMFIENPFLGVGFGGWNDNSISLEHKYPHNILFEILAELGIFGLLFFVIILINLRFRSTFGLLGVYGIISLLFSGDISYFRYSLFPFLIAVYLSNIDSRSRISENEKSVLV